MLRKALLPSLLFLNACGYTDEGGGTGTLEVMVEARYEVRDNELRLDVEVRDASNGDVNTAQVRMTDGDTNESFDLSQQGGPGSYRKDVSGYHRRLGLEVASGADNLKAQLEGPGKHLIDTPAHGSTTSRSADLDVEWSTEDGMLCDEIILELRSVNGGSGDDWETSLRGEDEDGSASIPKQNLGDGGRRLTVSRRNRINLAGGRGASSFFIEYQVRNEFVVTP